MKNYKRLKQALSVLLSVVLLVTLMSGCKKDSDEDEYSEYVVYEDEATDSTDNGGSKTENGESATVETKNKDKNSSSNTDKKSSNGTVNPADYKGTTVTYATWGRSEGIDTSGAIAAFKKKYGITVKVKTIAQDNYIQTVTGLISSGKAPDVIKDCDFWPAMLSIAQPLENAKINLKDPIWDQGKIAASTVDGKAYTISSVGPIFKVTMACFYNKKLLNSLGIPTPADYQAKGMWNYDAVYKIMKDTVAKGGKGYYGCYGDYLGYRMMESFGKYMFRFDNGKYTSDIKDPLYLQVSQTVAKWIKEGYLYNNRNVFINGKAPLAFTDTYGCLKTGYWYEMNHKDIGVIEMPSFGNHKPMESTMWNGYGICKGASNPVGGGLFLRYYLDCNNYDLNKEFISTDALNYVVKHTSSSSKGAINSYVGPHLVIGADRLKYYYLMSTTDPAQMPTLLNSINNEINSHLKTINNYMKQRTAIK